MTSATDLVGRVRGSIDPDHILDLAFGEFRVRVATNSADVIGRLEAYFRPFVAAAAPVDTTVTALQMAEPDLGLDYQPWPRDPGKIGLKDTFVDLPDGRACRKVRTGMQYLLTGEARLIFGDCLKNDAQVVNFIIAQYMNWLLDRGWVPCHAAAVSDGGRGLAIAANAGGGKSTLALRLVAGGYNFCSNDRTFIRNRDGHGALNGVPKQPRINPGTVLNNPALAPVIDAERRAALASLAPDALRGLEEKYDADIAALFGPGRFALAAPLDAFVILSWDWQATAAPRIASIDLAARQDLLPAIMKPPGPFYLPKDGPPPDISFAHGPDDYLAALASVPVYEVTGGVDFGRAADECREVLKNAALAAA